MWRRRGRLAVLTALRHAPAGTAVSLPEPPGRSSHLQGRNAVPQPPPASGSGGSAAADAGDSPAGTSVATRRAGQGSSVAGGSPSRASSMLYEYDPDYIERKCAVPPLPCTPVGQNRVLRSPGAHVHSRSPVMCTW